MHIVKQGMAAVVLIMSLGLVMPSAFGGSAAADPTPGQGTSDDTPRWLYCDRNGDGTDVSSYFVISQSNSSKPGFHDLNSSTVLVYQYDQRFQRYVPFVDPGDPGAPQDERAFVDILGRLRGPKVGGNGFGQDGKVVACQEDLQPNGDITACPDPSTSSDCPPLIAGAHYHAYQGRTWYVTLSGDAQGSVQVASVDHSKHKAKDGGKHHSKGKHGK